MFYGSRQSTPIRQPREFELGLSFIESVGLDSIMKLL